MQDITDEVAVLALLLLVAAGLVYLAAQRLARRLAAGRQGGALPPGLERRRHHRRPAGQVTVRLASVPHQQGIPVQNISPGGMCLAIDAGAVQADTVVQATLTAPGLNQPISAEARAIWIDKGRAGLAFTHTDVNLRRWLDSL